MAANKLIDCKGKLAFIFSTRGSQYPGMALGLARAEPVFRESLERCDIFLRDLVGWSLLQELESPDGSRIWLDERMFEPALIAIQISLVKLWRSRCITPDAVVAMSAGEVAAAYAADIISDKDALTLAVAISRQIDGFRGSGIMSALSAGAGEVEVIIAMAGSCAEVSTEYSPTATIIAGSRSEVQKVSAFAQRVGVKTSLVPASTCAFHTSWADPGRGEYKDFVSKVSAGTANAVVYSASTGGRLAQDHHYDAEHWWQVYRARARFSDATRSLVQDGIELVVEIGCHAVSVRSVQEHADSLRRPLTVVTSMSRDADNVTTFESACEAVAAFHGERFK